MADARTSKLPPKMMLGFIVRRCAADLGHTPTPDEFARWANQRDENGQRYCLFGKPISASAAKIMFRQPGRLVTVRSEGLVKNWNGNGQ
ncbi:MAG TPA: hypothetical protein VFM35_12050 [Candidatus Binatia bacterium]|nr:hypothetical protein [Candidatus Binatia bacterium]